jgi:hypothetical protein
MREVAGPPPAKSKSFFGSFYQKRTDFFAGFGRFGTRLA